MEQKQHQDEDLRRFPEFETELRELVREHLLIEDEPLLFAAYYAPERDEDQVFLFEIAENYGDNRIDPDHEFFEIGFWDISQVHLSPGQKVNLVITNPVEFEKGLEENWFHVKELRQALKSGKWRRLHGDERWQEKLL